MHNIILLGIVSFLTDVSSEMVYPLLPLFLTSQLGASPAIVGVIEGLAESSASLLKVFSGYFSDRIGKRKPIALAGYALSTLGKILFYFAFSWAIVLAGRLCDRFGKGVRTAPRDALIASSCNPKTYGLAFGLHRAMDTFGAVLGVFVAYLGMRQALDDFRPLFLYAVIPAGLGVMVLLFVREKRAEIPGTRSRLGLVWSGLDGRLKAFYVVIFIFTLGNSSNQFLLLRAQDLGFPVQDVLLLYLTYVGVYGVLAYPLGRLSDRVGRRRVLVFGYLMYGLVYLGFAMARGPLALWPLFALYGLYSAATEGVEKALISDMAPAEQRGTLIGLHATLVGIGLLPASLLAGLLWDVAGPQAPFFFGGALGVMSAVAIHLVLRPAGRTSA